jgi:hypothetical protein
MTFIFNKSAFFSINLTIVSSSSDNVLLHFVYHFRLKFDEILSRLSTPAVLLLSERAERKEAAFAAS